MIYTSKGMSENRTLSFKEKNIIYPKTIKVMEDITNQILKYNEKHTTFFDYDLTSIR
jgi:hypothetical protein